MDADVVAWVERALIDAQKRRAVWKLLDVEKFPVVSKGDNYTSEISRLKMKVVLYSGEVVERYVIYKCLPSTELMRKFINEAKLFVGEKRMYTEVLPLLEKIRMEKESGEPLWGECYKATNSMMLMEDLAVHGYKMGDRMNGLDFDHCKLVMKSLAKFHALSSVLRERGDLISSDFETHMAQRNKDAMKIFYKTSFVDLAKRVEQWKGEWVPYAEKLRARSDSALDDMLSDLTLGKSTFTVLNHGDFWVNNMLFKYDEDEQPISVRLVDFQLCFYNSVGVDLHHFMSTTPSLEAALKKEDLLEVYSHWLAVYMERFGYTGEIPVLETIRSEFARTASYGLVTAVLFLPLLKMPSKEVPDIEKLLEEFEKSEKKQTEAILNQSEEYENAIKAVLLRAKDYGII